MSQDADLVRLAGPALWLLVALALPVVACATALFARGRAALPRLLAYVPLPALAAAIAIRDGAAITVDPSGLAIGLVADPPRAMLLGAAALLWSLAGASAGRSLGGDARAGRFALSWVLSLTGCLGVFIAGDLASFYFFFGLASLSAYALVDHDGTPSARRASILYLALAVAGEAFLLIAFVLLAARSPGESIAIATVTEALPTSPFRDQTLVFLLLGFGLKMGLVPLHGWLPLAHPAAPAPASAILSGAIIKTGVIGLLCFLPLSSDLPRWTVALVVIGFATAFHGAIVGLLHGSPKRLLAYSSVSQMGVVAAMVGAGWIAGLPETPRLAGLYAVHHALAKGALFLVVGAWALAAPRHRRAFIAPIAVLSLALAGLPLTGGAVAKEAAKEAFASSPFATVLLVLATCSSIASAALMTRFVRRLAAEPAATDEGRSRSWWALALPCLALGVASIVAPWAIAFSSGSLASLGWKALSVGGILSAAWPVAIGVFVAYAIGERLAGVRPRPEGIAMAVLERFGGAVFGPGRWIERCDDALRRWPVAIGGALALTLLIAILLSS